MTYATNMHLRTNLWPDHPDYRRANNGKGMCNIGARARGHCYLGGIGCDVDHVMVALNNNRDDIRDLQQGATQ